MAIDIYRLANHEVIRYYFSKNNITDTQKNDFIKNIKSKILGFISEDELMCIDNNAEKIKDVDAEVIKKIKDNDELKKYILTYLYWKYKHKDSDKKVKFVDVKSTFKIINRKIENQIYPIKSIVKCRFCGNDAELSARSYHHLDKSFICSGCGHVDRCSSTSSEYVESYRYCTCAYCEHLRKEIREIYNNWILNSLKDYETIIEKLPLYIGKVEDEVMKRDFMIQKSNLCKDTRQIVEFNPKDIKDLEKLKKEIASKSKYSSDKKYLDTIDRKLLNKNIIYKYSEKNTSPYKLLYIYLYDVDVRGKSKLNRPLEFYSDRINNLLWNINNSPSFFENPSIFDSYKFNRIKFNPNLKIPMRDWILYSSFYDEYGEEHEIAMENLSDYRHCYDEKYELNPYFFNPVFVNNKKNTKFKSDGEKSIYSVLLNLYPSSDGYTVLNNPRLSDYINMDDINFAFEKEKALYASRCFVDFLILKDDIPFKVYELQKGEHHNEPDWIYKDRIKRIACLAGGLEFEECY